MQTVNPHDPPLHHPPRADPRSARVCTHWPLEGVVRIHAAATTLGTTAHQWMLPEVSAPQALRLLEDVRLTRACVAGLLQEFRRVGDWLVRGNGPARAPDGQPVHLRGLAASLGEDHRLLTKDRLAADMNGLVAWLLHQVVQMLDHLPLRAGQDEADLLDMPAYGDTLRGASDALEHAAQVADMSERFVEELDLRWHHLREQVTLAVALSRGRQRTR
jgi:hypothetical protein